MEKINENHIYIIYIISSNNIFLDKKIVSLFYARLSYSL